MKSVAKRDPVASLNENFLNQLQDVMTENLPVNKEDLPTITTCLQTYLKHEESIKLMVNSTVALENFRKVDEVLKTMWVCDRFSFFIFYQRL